MSEMDRNSISRVLVWTYAAPVVTGWAIISFLPLFGIFIADASIGSIAGDIFFFVAGFGGLFSIWVLAIVCAAQREDKSRIARIMQGRIGLIAAYATLWLTAYWLFKFFLV